MRASISSGTRPGSWKGSSPGSWVGAYGDPDIDAFIATTGATNTEPLAAIVSYLKGQSLWDSAVFWPMMSAQNYGSGAAVAPLGGLTTNELTLRNSPTWSAGGIVFNGTSQSAYCADFLGGGDLTVMVRLSNQTEPASTGLDVVAAQYDSAANKRSWILGSHGSGSADGPCAQILYRASDQSGTTAKYGDTSGPTSWGADFTRVVEWIDGGGRNAWETKTAETLALLSGTARTARDNVNSRFTLMDNDANGTFAGNWASGTLVCPMVIEAQLTTTQRETLTDLVDNL